MADIAFCEGVRTDTGICDLRGSCRRYLWGTDPRKQSIMQSWMEAPFSKDETGTQCDYYWKMIDED